VKQENQADKFAVELGYGPYLKTALIRNFGKNLDNIFISRLDSALNDTHPPLLQRLKNIQKVIDSGHYETPIEAFELKSSDRKQEDMPP